MGALGGTRQPPHASHRGATKCCMHIVTGLVSCSPDIKPVHPHGRISPREDIEMDRWQAVLFCILAGGKNCNLDAGYQTDYGGVQGGANLSCRGVTRNCFG